jgi:hypothetical protein
MYQFVKDDNSTKVYGMFSHFFIKYLNSTTFLLIDVKLMTHLDELSKSILIDIEVEI